MGEKVRGEDLRCNKNAYSLYNGKGRNGRGDSLIESGGENRSRQLPAHCLGCG